MITRTQAQWDTDFGTRIDILIGADCRGEEQQETLTFRPPSDEVTCGFCGLRRDGKRVHTSPCSLASTIRSMVTVDQLAHSVNHLDIFSLERRSRTLRRSMTEVDLETMLKISFLKLGRD